MSTANSTQRNDETSKISALANVPLVVGVIAVYAFFLASLYVTSLTNALHFPIANLLTSIDYIQFIPQTLAIRSGNYAFLLLISTPFLLIIPMRQAIKLETARNRARAQERDVPYQPKPRRFRRLLEFMARVKARLRPIFGFIARVKAVWRLHYTWDDAWQFFNIFYWLWIMVLLWSFALDVYSSGNFVTEYLKKNGRIYTISLKDGLAPIEGKLFLQSSMYLFATCDQDNSIIAIPQKEVSSITAPLQSPRDTATQTPISATQATTATRSPTASPTTSPVSSVPPATTATPSPTATAK